MININEGEGENGGCCASDAPKNFNHKTRRIEMDEGNRRNDGEEASEAQAPHPTPPTLLYYFMVVVGL